MRFSLSSNVGALEKDLSHAARRQLPFALSVALNRTAEDIRRNETKRLDKAIDRPTPFTRKAFAIRRSTKARPTARIFAKRAQSAYLSTLEGGGARAPKGRAIIVPQKIRLNRYGNILRKAIAKTIARKDTFSGKPNGRPGAKAGVWQRKGKKLIKLASYADRATYRPSLGFVRGSKLTASARFPKHFETAPAAAFASSKRQSLGPSWPVSRGFIRAALFWPLM